jgi:hypothetical protein
MENQAGEMEWSLGLVCPEEECQEIFETIESALAEARAKDLKFPRDNSKLHLPFQPAMKKTEAGELEPDEGFITLKFKRKRMIRKRGSAEKTLNVPPRIYDSDGKFVQLPEIPRGSRGKAVFDIYCYNTPTTKGVSFGLRGFQVVELFRRDESIPAVEGGWRAETELDQLLAADA